MGYFGKSSLRPVTSDISGQKSPEVIFFWENVPISPMKKTPGGSKMAGKSPIDDILMDNGLNGCPLPW